MEMVGLRGEPSLKKCEKVLFFFLETSPSWAEPDQRLRELDMLEVPSERGGTVSPMLLLVRVRVRAVKEALCLRVGGWAGR